MKQKYFCELDEEDITKIIADHFNVDVNKVSMSCGIRLWALGRWSERNTVSAARLSCL